VYRTKTLQSFKIIDGLTYYSEVVPFRITGHIDGLYQWCLLAGAARNAGDHQVESIAISAITSVLKYGHDVRYICNEPRDGLDEVDTGVWAKRKPQVYAGPLAYSWAVKQGCDLEPWPDDMEQMAKWMCCISKAYFWIIKRSRLFNLRQHINTIMLAHLLLDRRPPSTASFLLQGNAFYAAIAGARMPIPVIPNIYKTTDSVNQAKLVPVDQREGGDWIWKQWPYAKSVARDTRYEYNPISLLIGTYMSGE